MKMMMKMNMMRRLRNKSPLRRNLGKIINKMKKRLTRSMKKMKMRRKKIK